MELTEIEARVGLFGEMVGCCHNLYLWQYDSGFHLIRSSCPHEAAVNNLFTMRRQESEPTFYTESSTPVLLTNEVGMMWITQGLCEDEELIRSFVLGPFFVDDTAHKGVEEQLDKLGLSFSLRQAAHQFVWQLPVISLSRAYEYAIMLHYCVTGQTVQVSDLRYEDQAKRPAERDHVEQMDVHGTYEAEREMLRMVREGDVVNFRAHMNRLSMTGQMGKISNGDPLRQMKNALITCLVLFSRAAMEGGLDPEISYSLSDRYFQSIEACRSIPELVEIGEPMQEDYIQRVHRIRTGYASLPIQTCCDYISLHLEEPLSLPELAKRAGYSEYYLSRKFKKETGESVSEYIRRERLERAALLLRTTQEDAQKIAARLQFCSQSRFSENFKKQYGVTPGAYRAGAWGE